MSVKYTHSFVLLANEIQKLSTKVKELDTEVTKLETDINSNDITELSTELNWNIATNISNDVYNIGYYKISGNNFTNKVTSFVANQNNLMDYYLKLFTLNVDAAIYYYTKTLLTTNDMCILAGDANSHNRYWVGSGGGCLNLYHIYGGMTPVLKKGSVFTITSNVKGTSNWCNFIYWLVPTKAYNVCSYTVPPNIGGANKCTSVWYFFDNTVINMNSIKNLFV